MTLHEAYQRHAYAKKRFRKEYVAGNKEKAREWWEEAERLWRSIGLATFGRA